MFTRTLFTRTLTLIALIGLTLGTPSVALAQRVPLSQLLVNLIQSEIRLAPPPEGFPSHEAHFIPGADQREAPYLFNQELLAQLGTFPIGSPSGGFSYTFDPALGTFQRTTESFGPAFADRALTLGRRRVSLGLNLQHSRYRSFEGADLRNGDVRFYLRHLDVGGFAFEGDLVEAALNLDVSSTTMTIFASYGLADLWDVSLAVPIQRVVMDATVNATVLRLATGADSQLHAFPGGDQSSTFSSSDSASGIGDLLVRTKYRFLSTPGGGLAAGLDVRLPTGDEAELLGTGATQVGVSLIGSSTMGQFAPHFNVGYTGSSSGSVVDIPNEFGYRLGAEFIATPTVTLAADLIGRSLLDMGTLEFGNTTWNYANPQNQPASITLHELVSRTGTLNLLSLAAGGKFNVATNLLVNANVLVALSSRGVTARVTPVIGFDYSF